MSTITLGKTGITIEKNGFGCLPIQRISKEEAAKLLRRAYDGGMTYFDTARAYSDSEEKVNAEKQLNGINAKLSNEKFLEKAPEAVVNGEREKAEKLKALIEKLDASAAALKK